MTDHSTTVSKLATKLTLLTIIAFALSLRLFNIEKEPYWVDESFTTWFASLSYTQLAFWAPTFETQPTLYYMLVKLWNNTVGEFTILQIASERYLSLLLSVLLIPVAYKATDLLQKSDGYIPKLLIVVLVSFSPIISWYSIEARSYSLFILSFAFSVLGFIGIAKEAKKGGIRYWIILSTGTLMTNWSHSLGPLYSFVVYVALLIHLTQNYSPQLLRRSLTSVSIVFILSLPLLLQLIYQAQNWAQSTWIPEPSLSTLYREFIHLYVIRSGIIDQKLIVNLIALTAPLLVLVGMVKAYQKRDLIFFYLVLFTFFVPIVCFFTSKVGPNILLSRALIPVLIPYFLLLSLSITYIHQTNIKVLITLCLATMLIHGAYEELQHREKEPWDQVESYIQENTSSDDVVLLLPNFLELALNNQTNQSKPEINFHPLLGKFPAIGTSNFYPSGLPSAPGFRQEDKPKLEALLHQQEGRPILITRSEEHYNPEQLVQDVITQKGFRLSQTIQFKSISIYDYERL